MAFTIASASGGGPASSFTPTVTFATPGTLSVAYTTQSGTYVKVGTVYIFSAVVEFSPTLGTASGAFRLSGLPIAPSVDCAVAIATAVEDWEDLDQFSHIFGLVQSGQAYLQIVGTDHPSDSIVTVNNFYSGGDYRLVATGILIA